ncbi:PadR family transcriptional regulator [Paenactinomyces guangxiensis]|uniref:Helix-turn-helix transcriptional regulator n=1 Tax=Paenactinomyces guangxiensis TaxID=1490290 RepID=A0A7W2A7X7_9BACL|nr:helix-turn-helix transcriptional regulator [Paenactinomyces guangxiensis]MBA4493579.1 helix-turn-helix transcriptional regulator [Paenactinomyces guangxiensis]MBH8590670.1 helix-turn-helix transcriptional regulator [Paenactinomyces guangxiensis]
MKRDKHLPLTETVYYILLSLLEPAHGYLIMQKVEELSDGQVRMAAGTLYGAIENLLKLKFIQPVHSQDSRRKVYMITQKGKEILRLDFERMQHMIKITEDAFKVKNEEDINEKV